MKLYHISLNNLYRRRTRFVFLVLGLVIGISTVVTLVTISEAMNTDISRRMDEFGANIVIVPKSDDLSLSYGGMSISNLSFDVRPLQDEDIQKIRSIKNRENISVVAPKLFNVTKIRDREVLVVGVDFEQESRLKKWWSVTGKLPQNENGALVGAEAKEKLGVNLLQIIEIAGIPFTVAGILEPTGSQDDEIVFIDLKRSQSLFEKENRLSMIEVAALCYDCPIEEIVRQTSERLPGARVTAIRQAIDSKMDTMHRFQHFSVGISFVVLFIGALIVFTTMTASVNDRRREIGVFRSIGFRQSHIISIYLIEAFISSFLAGLAGYFLGLGVSRFVAPLVVMSGKTEMPFNHFLLIFAIILAILTGMLSSIYPAYKAARLDPIVALKTL